MTDKTTPDRYTLGLTDQPTVYDGKYADGSPFPWPADQIQQYTAYRIDEPAWTQAPRSPRFTDMITGSRGIHDTRAAVLWDRHKLYVGYWLEEPDVQADLTERDSLIFLNNDVELFIAGRDGFNQYREAPPQQDSGAQFWSPHGTRDSHVPELFPIIRFTEELLPRDK